MKKRSIILGIIVVCVLGVLVFAVIIAVYVRNNTSFLSSAPTQEVIQTNNFNNPTISGVDFTELVAVPLHVPEAFAAMAPQDKILNVPAGFRVSVYAAGLQAPRFFDFDDAGNIYVADKSAGTVEFLPDTNNDGVADAMITVISDLQQVHSVAYYKGDLYIGEEHQVSVLRGLNDDGTYASQEVLVPDLPTGGGQTTGYGHHTRTVVIGPDEKLYVSIGSSCNVCDERDARRAAIVQYNLDGSGERVFASGLRNSVGFAFHGDAQDDDAEAQLWAVDNGRDLIGDETPPEELNVIEEGKHYGWPYCHGRGIVSPEYPAREDFCAQETAHPFLEMQAHSAPLGMTFFPEEFVSTATGNFPQQLQDDLFIAFHGSWNRTVPTGYKIVRADISEDESSAGESGVLNFITGWLDQSGDVWGRPVGVEFNSNGDLFISDDKAGVLYRVEYVGTEGDVDNNR